MPGPNEHEMHPTKVFIRQCEKLGKFLESWKFRAVCKKADILRNLEKAGTCPRQNSLASEGMSWMGLCYRCSLTELEFCGNRRVTILTT